MGQIFSLGNEKKNDEKNKTQDNKKYVKSLEGRLDIIASDYILRQNFQDMKNLMDSDKCNKLIILTGDLISKYFKDLNVEHLKSRYNDSKNKNDTENTSVHFAKILEFTDDLKQESKEKAELCVGIAKYYVQIAHLFAAITMTVNPKYTYSVNDLTDIKTENNNTTNKSQNNSSNLFLDGKKTLMWFEKNKIPKDKEIITTFHGLCDNRISILKNNNTYSITDKNTPIKIEPRICDMEPIQSLYQEPGIPELEMLYKDVYDYDTGKFVEMSDKMKEKYKSDLKNFYTTFTGEKEMPETIQNFRDIPIINYSNRVGCIKKTAQFPFGFDFKGGIVKKNSDGDILFFGSNGSDMPETLIDVENFKNEFRVVKSDGVGKPGYKITLWGEILAGQNIQPKITFVNGHTGLYRNPQYGTLNDKLFSKYAEKMQNMISKTEKNKEELLNILDSIFEKTLVNEVDLPVVKIKESLTQSELDKLIKKTREIIVSMYLSCEDDFSDLLNVFDAIIDRQILAEAESSKEQLKELTYQYERNLTNEDYAKLEKEKQDIEEMEKNLDQTILEKDEREEIEFHKIDNAIQNIEIDYHLLKQNNYKKEDVNDLEKKITNLSNEIDGYIQQDNNEKISDYKNKLNRLITTVQTLHVDIEEQNNEKSEAREFLMRQSSFQEKNPELSSELPSEKSDIQSFDERSFDERSFDKKFELSSENPQGM